MISAPLKHRSATPLNHRSARTIDHRSARMIHHQEFHAQSGLLQCTDKKISQTFNNISPKRLCNKANLGLSVRCQTQLSPAPDTGFVKKAQVLPITIEASVVVKKYDVFNLLSTDAKIGCKFGHSNFVMRFFPQFLSYGCQDP